MAYLKWDEKKITNFGNENINAMYDRGFVFTRKGNGIMNQTRSVRIDLSKFELSSENRRISKKTDGLRLTAYDLPYQNYDWEIGKMAKDFYDEKFGEGTFSANKIKELLTTEGGNFNKLLIYFSPYQGESEGVVKKSNNGGSKDPSQPPLLGEEIVGYCITRESDKILHYSYPFYNLKPKTHKLTPNIGMGMMLRAIEYEKEKNKKYIYLGSAQRPTDTYKLQFKGLEWFDKDNGWSDKLEELKSILKS